METVEASENSNNLYDVFLADIFYFLCPLYLSC